jgi:hypothetical protein
MNPRAALPGAVRRALGGAAALTLPLALVLLQGCASAPPPVVAKPVEKTDGTPKTTSPRLQAEMDAALPWPRRSSTSKASRRSRSWSPRCPTTPSPDQSGPGSKEA